MYKLLILAALVALAVASPVLVNVPASAYSYRAAPAVTYGAYGAAPAISYGYGTGLRSYATPYFG